MRRFFPILILFVIAAMVSCQKEIEVDLPEYQQKIVIEGSIENGQPAMVVVSKSFSYYQKIDLETLMSDVFITNAEVEVESSTGEVERLNLTMTPESPVYVAYRGRNVLGEPGKSYTLRVRIDGKEYTSTTTICEPVKLDSAWLSFKSETDTMPTSRILLSDNPSLHQYYMFRLKVHGEHWPERSPVRFSEGFPIPALANKPLPWPDRLWVTSMPVAFDDATFSGQTVNYEVLRTNPSDLFLPDMSDEESRDFYRITYRPGDTVYLKTSIIDYDGFQYWSAMTYPLAIGQNPFMSPAPIPCNIQGENVIGNWCGFASTVDTLYYPKR